MLFISDINIGEVGMHTKVPKKEIQKIKKEIEKEFPEDPMLQEIHIARKVIAYQAKKAGMSYIQYIQHIKEKAKSTISSTK